MHLFKVKGLKGESGLFDKINVYVVERRAIERRKVLK